MKVLFIYQSDDKSIQREIVATKLCEAVSQIIELPDIIEIEFSNLSQSVYGETIINPRFKNRIRINNTLNAKEIIPAIVHELIHLNQTHTGLLSMTRDGRYIWKNKIYTSPAVKELSFNEHSQLPWEIDVAQRQQKVLNEAIQSALTKK